MLADLGFNPQISVSGSGYADLTVTEKNGNIFINLINMAGDHNVPTVRSYGEIPEIGPLDIAIDPALGITEP